MGDIINNLTKIIQKIILFYEVTGFNFTMLENSKCENMYLEYMTLPEVTKNVKISGNVTLKWVFGDLIGLFSKLSCDHLKICDMKLSNSETRSLTKMFSSRVR